MYYAILAPSPLLLNDAFLWKSLDHFSHTTEEKWRGSSFTPHHGPWSVLRSYRGLGWNQFSALFLLHGRRITWVSMEEVKIHPIRVKCWVKWPEILQNTSNNHTQA